MQPRSPHSANGCLPGSRVQYCDDGPVSRGDGNASTGLDETIVGYSWNFGHEATLRIPIASHSHTAVGSYGAALTVIDDLDASFHLSKPLKDGDFLVIPPASVNILAVDLRSGSRGQLRNRRSRDFRWCHSWFLGHCPCWLSGQMQSGKKPCNTVCFGFGVRCAHTDGKGFPYRDELTQDLYFGNWPMSWYR